MIITSSIVNGAVSGEAAAGQPHTGEDAHARLSQRVTIPEGWLAGDSVYLLLILALVYPDNSRYNSWIMVSLRRRTASGWNAPTGLDHILFCDSRQIGRALCILENDFLPACASSVHL